MKTIFGRNKTIFALTGLLVIISSCEKLDLIREIALSTKRIEIMTSSDVRATGEILDEGEGIKDYGFVFSSTNNTPTIASASGVIESVDRAKPGEFVQIISGLEPRVLYYVRAYATPDGTNYRYSDPTSFIIDDVWTQKSNFGGVPRANAVAFTIDGKGYMGMGNNATDYLYDFWVYDQELNTWTQKADFPSGTTVTNFNIATPSWAILGVEGTQETWAYDFDGNTWVQKADFPGVARFVGFSFHLAGNVYFGGGVVNEPALGYPLDLWEYDPGDDVWTRKADFPGPGREHAASLKIGQNGYVGMGLTMDELDNATYHTDFWEYDPISGDSDTRGNPLGVWTQKANAPSATKFLGYSFDMKGFVFSQNRFLIYDPALNYWSETEPFSAVPRVNAAGFALNGRAYVGTGVYDAGGGTFAVIRDFWEYIPPVL